MNLNKINPRNWFNTEAESNSGQIRESSDRQVDTQGRPSEYHDTMVQPLHRMLYALDRLIDDVMAGFQTSEDKPSFWSRCCARANWFKSSVFGNKINVSDSEETYLITLEIPGFSKSDLSVEAHNGVLKIKGQKQTQSESNDRYFYRSERTYGAFQRMLQVPRDADLGGGTATAKDGILAIRIPRRKILDAPSKRIEIKVSD